MTPPLPKPSSRLVRAALSERDNLREVRNQVEAERDRVATSLRQLEATLAELDDRLRVLASIAPDAEVRSTLVVDDPGVTPERNGTTDERTLLRGPVIREVAVQVLLSQPHDIEALHYRRWYELIRGAGYEVAGKDPLAVFLTQLSRSPVVRKSTEAGVYEIDRHAPDRLRKRLQALTAELREATTTPEAPAELAEIRARRHDLQVTISQQERALEEAQRVLPGPAAESRPTTAAAG